MQKSNDCLVSAIDILVFLSSIVLAIIIIRNTDIPFPLQLLIIPFIPLALVYIDKYFYKKTTFLVFAILLIVFLFNAYF